MYEEMEAERKGVWEQEEENLGSCMDEPKAASQDQLLKKLEELNKSLEEDRRALTRLPLESIKASDQPSSVKRMTSPKTTDETLPISEEELCKTWSHLIADWDSNVKKKWKYIRELAWKGIPNPMRSLVWPLLAGVNMTYSPLKETYPQLLASTSPFEKHIQRDLTRTFPEHDFFKNGPGQEALQNILKAYSVYDKEVGYCQGSPFLAGLLLLQMPEEDAFCVFVKMLEDYNLREIYKPLMTELGVCLYQLEKLTEEVHPNLNKHFLSLGFSTSMYGSSWFVTLFASCLSLNVVYRVIDAFLVDGMSVVFRVGLALLQCDTSQLLTMDIETMLKHFQKGMRDEHEADPSRLMSTAWSIKWDNYTKKMKKWQQEFVTKKEKMQEENQELKRLRAENDYLHLRLNELEKECESLAGKLIQGQVTRAQEAENMYILEKEVRVLRKMSKKVSVDDPVKSVTSISVVDVSERESSVEGTSDGHVFSDNDQESTLTQSEELVRTLPQEPVHRMNSISSGGRLLELEKELAAQRIEAEEAADELERKRHELQAAGNREDMLRQQLDTANTKIASLEEHLSKAKELLKVLLGPPAEDHTPNTPSPEAHSQPLNRKSFPPTLTDREFYPATKLHSNQSYSTSDSESEEAIFQQGRPKRHRPKPLTVGVHSTKPVSS